MTEIKLNIKSLDSDDQILSSDLKHSVKDVKLQIEREWESHPKPSDQRLVYAGKLLQDSSILEEVLRLTDARDENDAFTIHLVCRFTKPKPKSEVRKRVNISEPRVSEVQPPSAVGSQQMSNPWASTNPEHAALMQQMYANYINQYMQYLQSMGVTPNWPPTATQSLIEHTNQINEEARQVPAVFDPVAAAAVAGAVANNLPADNVAQAAPVVHQDVQGQQPIGDAANLGNANVVMNAGGGAGGIAGAMEDEDDLNGGQRDILDWCYVVTRVLVLFSVVYFYSSLARFALAAGLGIIFYLYNNGFFGQRDNNNEQNAAVNEVRQVAGAAGGEENQNQNENEANQQEGGEGRQAEDAAPEAPAPPHVLTVMATFVTTFFTSLMPNDPQIV